MIRQNTGIERLRLFFTGMRQYRCRDCDQKFRAPDRRKSSREEPMGMAVAPRRQV